MGGDDEVGRERPSRGRGLRRLSVDLSRVLPHGDPQMSLQKPETFSDKGEKGDRDRPKTPEILLKKGAFDTP